MPRYYQRQFQFFRERLSRGRCDILKASGRHELSSTAAPQSLRPSRSCPTARAEMDARGWDELDIIIVIGRRLRRPPGVRAGADRALPRGPRLQRRHHRAARLAVGRAVPRARPAAPVLRRHRPGNLDSMLNRLTAQKKNRGEDQYSPGRRAPAAAPIAPPSSTRNRCREAFPDVPDRARRHRGVAAPHRALRLLVATRCGARSSSTPRPTCWSSAWASGRSGRSRERLARGREDRASSATSAAPRYVIAQGRDGRLLEADPAQYVSDGSRWSCPSYEEVDGRQGAPTRAWPRAVPATRPTRATRGRSCSAHGDRGGLLQPAGAAARRRRGRGAGTAMDELYDLPFNRAPHPSYARARSPPSRRSSTRSSLMRGCFGGCTFCSITEHEGRVIQSRSAESVLRELRALRRMDDFRGVDHRPRRPDRQHVQDALQDRDDRDEVPAALLRAPGVCENLVTDHGPLIDLMKQVREEPRACKQGLHRLGRALRPGRALAGVHRASSPRTTSAGSSRSRPSTSPTRARRR